MKVVLTGQNTSNKKQAGVQEVHITDIRSKHRDGRQRLLGTEEQSNKQLSGKNQKLTTSTNTAGLIGGVGRGEVRQGMMMEGGSEDI